MGWKHTSCLGLVGKLNTNWSGNPSFQGDFLLRFCQLCPFDFIVALLHTADWWVFEAVMWRTPQRRYLMKQKATLSWLTTYCCWQLLSISVPNYLHVFSLVCPHLGCQATARCVYWLEHSQSIHPHTHASISHSSFFLQCILFCPSLCYHVYLGFFPFMFVAFRCLSIHSSVPFLKKSFKMRSY